MNVNAITHSELSAIDRVGIVEGLSIDDYHAGPGISKSGLDDINASPAIYYGRHLDPQRPAETRKGGQLEGQLAHCAILEPDEFSKRYIVGPDVASRNAKAWKDFEAANPGLECIKRDEYEAAMRQADAVRKLPEIADALSRGRAEVSAYWRDPVTGVLCRCRPDFAHDCGTNGVILLDVKTCGDASPAEFARQIARKRYHVQDAFYTDGYSAASGREVLAFVFVAVEAQWPHAACAVMLDEPGKDHGRREYRRNLNTYAECLKSGEWPGYSNQIQIVNLPAWAIREEETA